MRIEKGMQTRGMACLALLALGCGGEDEAPATLTCEWLTSPDNCWRDAVAEAASCAPGDSVTGTLSADGLSCSYVDTWDLSFDQALVLPIDFDTHAWRFTLNSQGGLCARFEEPNDSSMKLTVASGSVTLGASASSYSITCQDGRRYSNPDPFSLLGCGDLSGLPGHASGTSSSSASFALFGGPSGSTSIWSCSQ